MTGSPSAFTSQGQSFGERESIVFYSDNLRNSTGAHSLAALMTALVRLGHDVHLITYEPPGGEDFITDSRVGRSVLSYMEFEGYSLSAAFYKTLGTQKAKTVVFFSPFSKNTYPCFVAAEKLGRCTILAFDHSPLLPVAGGDLRQTAEVLYMLQNAACCVSISEQDCRLLGSMGSKNSVYLPYYFPYSDEEVAASDLDGSKIVFYTTYLSKNTRTVIGAFARLHERYPDAKMHIIVLSNVFKNNVLNSLVADVTASDLVDCLTIETRVLKPLRQLRDSCISVTYAHLNHMPRTVMESLCAGIPTIKLQDADYTKDSQPSICLRAADADALEDTLAQLLDKKNREAFSDRTRKLLGDAYRRSLAEDWSAYLEQTAREHDALLTKSLEENETLCADILTLKAQGTSPSDIIRLLALRKIPLGRIVGACMRAGYTVSELLAAYQNGGLLVQQDYYLLRSRLTPMTAFEGQFADGADTAVLLKQYKSKEAMLPDIIGALATGGTAVSSVSACLPEILADEKQVNYVLERMADTNKNNRAVRQKDYVNAELLKVTEGLTEDAGVYDFITAFKGFANENYRFINFKNHRLIKEAIKFQIRFNRPLRDMSVLGKLLAAPFKLRTNLKIAIHNMSKRKLAKRKVTEVDPADTRKIQLLVLQILLEFDKLCKKHNLRYYIAGGSILGAVRHKGFIPWDDDIDLTMPRPDYEKLLKIAKKELPPEYILEKDCVPYCHNRIEIRNTRFETYLRKGRIFLDILALEGSPEDESKRREHEMKCKFWRTAMLEKARPFPAMSFSKPVIKVFIKRLILRLVPRRFLKWRWHRWATKYSVNETDSWVCLPASIYTYEQERFPKEYWGDPVYVEFEGHMLPTMRHWEDYLVCHFGNYMKLPPETTRKSHHYIFGYDLGKYADISTEDLEKAIVKTTTESV